MVTDMEMQLIHFQVLVPQFKKTTKKCFVFYYLKLYLYIFLSMVQLLTMFEIIYLYPLYAFLSYQQLICNKQILIYLEKSFSVNDDL